ncbi:MAG: hypothetical protein ACREV1_07445 [Gammaproteobacteria bacterium]
MPRYQPEPTLAHARVQSRGAAEGQFLEYSNLRHLSELPLLDEPTGSEQLPLALAIDAELEPETAE